MFSSLQDSSNSSYRAGRISSRDVLTPEPWTHSLFLDIVQYSEIPRGGHYAAFEEPELFADDVIKFVEKVEKRIAAKKAKDTTEPKSE